jgi:sugar phosphate isomerase/epimerase
MELNVRDLDDPRTRRVSAIQDFLGEFDLKLSMFASGLTAKTHGLSLSAVEKAERTTAVEATKGMIDWVAAGRTASTQRAETPVGIIIGFLKGGISADPAAARAGLIESLMQLGPYAAERSVPLILEATNRYESSVVNSIDDGIKVIDEVMRRIDGTNRPTPLQILPDTFHMNIEEADMVRSMGRGLGYYTSFHLSDNNRLFPGFGAIDFKKVVNTLDDLGYRGRLAVEGNLKKDLLSDLSRTVEYLSPFVE